MEKFDENKYVYIFDRARVVVVIGVVVSTVNFFYVNTNEKTCTAYVMAHFTKPFTHSPRPVIPSHNIFPSIARIRSGEREKRIAHWSSLLYITGVSKA